MRPLKPYLLALSGLIAAVFGGLFLGTPAKIPLLAATGPMPELEPKNTAPSREIVAGRDAKLPVGKLPAPQPHLPALPFWRSETLRLAFAPVGAAVRGAPEPLFDRRARLLVGVIELRI